LIALEKPAVKWQVFFDLIMKGRIIPYLLGGGIPLITELPDRSAFECIEQKKNIENLSTIYGTREIFGLSGCRFAIHSFPKAHVYFLQISIS